MGVKGELGFTVCPLIQMFQVWLRRGHEKASGKFKIGHESVPVKGKGGGMKVSQARLKFKVGHENIQASLKVGHESVSGKVEKRSRSLNIGLVLCHQQCCNPPAKYEDSQVLI